jgi:hypothetical protein
MDIFVVIPCLLEDCEKHVSVLSTNWLQEPSVTSEGTFSGIRNASLKERIANQLQLLFRWRWEWQYQYGYGVRAEEQFVVYTTSSQYSQGNCVKFEFGDNSMVRAAEIALYNALLLWLLVLLWNIIPNPLEVKAVITDCANHARLASYMREAVHEAIYQKALSFEPFSAPGDFIGLRVPAIEICRVYQWQSRHHHLASKCTEPILLYIYPLGMATSVLEREIDIRDWISEMVGNSPITSGYKANRFKMVRFSSLLKNHVMINL